VKWRPIVIVALTVAVIAGLLSGFSTRGW